jgi:non-homologous end joining protein Ku
MRHAKQHGFTVQNEGVNANAKCCLNDQRIATAKKAPPSNVYNVMDALRASIKGDERTAAEKPAKAAKKEKLARASAKRKAG